MSKPAKPSAWKDVFDMPLDELTKRAETARGLIQQVVDLFPGLVTLTEEERRHSNGRIRRGEGAMFLTLLSAMETFPQFFEGIADRDDGVDPTKVEIELMRDRVERAEALAPIADLMETLGGLSDTVLVLRGKVREPMSEAYGIAKAMAKTNQALRSKIAPIIDFYSAMARAAAASRKANAERRSAEKG